MINNYKSNIPANKMSFEFDNNSRCIVSYVFNKELSREFIDELNQMKSNEINQSCI
jgi:hypothetical protein